MARKPSKLPKLSAAGKRIILEAVRTLGGYTLRTQCRGRELKYKYPGEAGATRHETIRTCHCAEDTRAMLPYKTPDLIAGDDTRKGKVPLLSRQVKVCVNCDRADFFPRVAGAVRP